MNANHHILRAIGALWLLCLGLWAPMAQAQSQADAALLVADEVLITREGRLVARGNVEALYNDIRLYTDEIIYDQEKDVLIINNPIQIIQENGDMLIADSADLDSKLENGILRGARYVLDQELQVLSAQTDRVDGRYTVMRKVISTSCQICQNGPPIWQIRADRAIHDREEKQVYFRRAQFRLLGVPVLYLPRLRIPDPSLKRATGFLMPRFVSNSKLGFGIKTPYFIKTGEHSDITVTPFVTQKSNTLEWRYRKAFFRGYTEFKGAIAKDQLLPNDLRYYITGYGAFDLGQRVVLSFDVESTSDAGFMSTYGYSGKDRLGSNISLSRITRNSFFYSSLYNVETLRDNETNDTQPTLLADVRYERRFRLPNRAGEITAGLDIHGHKRVSLTDQTGRDMARISVDLGWQNQWTLANGLRAGLATSLGIDSHAIRQDSTVLGRQQVITPAAAVTLRWPFKATAKSGAHYIVEPIAQIGWAGGSPSTIPNDMSISAEFDEGNLLALSRFPTKERRETGTTGVLGLRWERIHPEGWSAGLSIGQVFRDRADPTFTNSSGLQGLTSDTLLSMHMETNWGGAIRLRGLFDNSFEPIKSEAQFVYARNKLTLFGTYVQLKADAAELRTTSVAEWKVDATYKVNRHWTTKANWQYDLIADQPSKAGGSITYENECLSIGVGLTQTFANSVTRDPVTAYEFSVNLRGFSTGGSGKAARRTCRK